MDLPSHAHVREQALVDACVAGDPEAWRQLKDDYRRLIRATAARVSNRGDSEVDDLEALVYEKLLSDRCRRLRAWEGRAKFSTYLVQVVRNLVLDWLDRQRRTLPATPLEFAPETAGESPDLEEDEHREVMVAAMREAIAELPDGQRMILQLRLEGVSLRDIAQMLNRPVGTVSVENSRALARLRRKLEDVAAAAAGRKGTG